MRTFTRVAAIAAIPSVAFAVSLSDFTPRVSNLPTACQLVYTTQILGCQASDFQGNHGCSNNCIAGMNSIVAPIQLACSNAGVTGNNPLNAFLQGHGVTDLCPNAPASTTSTTQQQPTTTSTSTTSTQQQTTTDQPSSTDTSSSTSTSTSTSAAAATTSSSSTSSSSSSMSTGSSSSQSSSSSSSSSSSVIIVSDTSSNTATAAARPTNNSGGGSPFDSTSTGVASGLSVDSSYAFALFLSALLAGYLL